MPQNVLVDMKRTFTVMTSFLGLALVLSGCSASQEYISPPEETTSDVATEVTSFDPQDNVTFVYQYADNDWMRKVCDGPTLLYSYVLGTTGGAMKTDDSSECTDAEDSASPRVEMVVIYENPGDWMRKICDGTTLVYSYWLSNTGGAMKTENSQECVG